MQCEEVALLNLEPHRPGSSPWHLSCFRSCHRRIDLLPVRLGTVAARGAAFLV